MIEIYKNLDLLLQNNSTAKDFFNSLTETRQKHVREYSHLIHCPKDLRMYGELLITGGD